VYDGAANNISFTMRMGNAEGVEPAFARAHHVTRLPLRNNRWTADQHARAAGLAGAFET